MTTSSKLNFRSCQPKHILTNRTVNLFQDRADEGVFFFIPFENTIKMSANSLIVFENSLIVFLICQGENKICSIENKNSPFEEVLLF